MQHNNEYVKHAFTYILLVKQIWQLQLSGSVRVFKLFN